MHCHCDEIAKLFTTKIANDDLRPHLTLWEALGGEANRSMRLNCVEKRTGKEWLLVRNDENRIIGLATDNKWYNEVAYTDDKLFFYRSTFRPGFKERVNIEYYVTKAGWRYSLVCSTNVKEWEFDDWESHEFADLNGFYSKPN